MTNDRRDQIIEIVKREFIGPDPLPYKDMTQENGEEILTSDNPLIRYVAGILFPQGLDFTIEKDDDQAEQNSSDNIDIDTGELSISDAFYDTKEMLEDAEELINLSNAFKQSAISITAAVFHNDEVSVEVNAGRYISAEVPAEISKAKRGYKRIPITWNNDSVFLELPDKNEPLKTLHISTPNGEAKLDFCITYRYTDNSGTYSVYTFTLVNSKKISYETHSPTEKDCFFQVEFELNSVLGFAAMPENMSFESEDEDYLINKLLYRNVRNYAIGHGCSADWEENNNVVKKVKTSIIPAYEIKPVLPRGFDDIELKMFDLSDYGNFETSVKGLKLLCQRYKEWISERSVIAKGLHAEYKNIAEHNIAECLRCHQRMVHGIELLDENENSRKAFLYMNRAMLLQQLHYRLPLQLWETDSADKVRLEKKFEKMPDIMNPVTWYDTENQKYGEWRPFQIAFILINIESMLNPYSKERGLVDLIWFPTGGGKTEAYLGLSAFTIFLRKLQNKDDTGTVIIMRYTLRLLTSQQYDRASSMICACETIRKEKEDELGKNRITIGLWVGLATTPNKMDDAVKEFDRLYRGDTTDNPFGVLKCPWCGAQMGVINTKNRIVHIKGYYKTTMTGRGKKKIVFQCDNENCDFSKSDFNLPLNVVDEAIYENPSTLIIGTVDKFAMLPYRPEAQRLFGIEGTEKLEPPELIIQDELHLISGPLGSMVGHYETMINALCTRKTAGGIKRPKIIASTATISRAKEQCHALYCCGKENVIQFPPPGTDAGESFFAYTDNNAVGRKYVGIFAPGASSHATTNIRLYATMLYAAKALIVENENERDPYWTNLGYYNSLRELGQAATWVNADINEYLHTIYKRRYEDKDEKYREKRRYIYRTEELTSRIKSDKISSSLLNLAVSYPIVPDKDKEYPIDICLATNMISVGVDIPRLGLMTVAGQPKTSAEYIQATSRVGRIAAASGIIFAVYNPGKPRDRSHYEHFRSYHSKIYAFVEPTSVTPFSSPLRKRALHAIIFGLIRLMGDKTTYNNPKILPTPDEKDNLINIIMERVNEIDETEYENTVKNITAIFEKWKNNDPQKYHDFSAGEAVPLMYPAGKKPNVNWEDRGFETPMSMRSVDLPCEINVLPNGYMDMEA